MLTWDGAVTIYHKRYMNELGIILNVEAYIQLLKNNSVSFDQRLNMIEGNELEEAEVRLPELFKGVSKV